MAATTTLFLRLPLIRLFVLIVTLKERLCSEIGYAQPQDRNFVQFWDNVGFERQDRSQVVQLPIETLPSRARYGYDRFGWKRKEKFLKFCCNQSNTSQLYNYSLTNRCWRINIRVQRPPSSNSLRNQNGKVKKVKLRCFKRLQICSCPAIWLIKCWVRQGIWGGSEVTL